MTLQEIDTLRKEVKHRMIDLGLDREGSYDLIAPHLSRRMNRPVSKPQICTALTGYRNGRAQAQMLESLKTLLQAWPPGTA